MDGRLDYASIALPGPRVVANTPHGERQILPVDSEGLYGADGADH